MLNYNLRPHHLLCTYFFEGKGYSDNFTSNMKAIIAEFTNNNPTITLIPDCDVICNACPNNKNNMCKSSLKVKYYDNIVLELTGLEFFKPLKFNDLKEITSNKIIQADKLKSICGDCQWFEICSKSLISKKQV